MLFLIAPGATAMSVIDSPVDNKYSFIEIDDCYAPVLKSKLNDWCYILKIVNSYCDMKLDTTKECGGKK